MIHDVYYSIHVKLDDAIFDFSLKYSVIFNLFVFI